MNITGLNILIALFSIKKRSYYKTIRYVTSFIAYDWVPFLIWKELVICNTSIFVSIVNIASYIYKFISNI